MESAPCGSFFLFPRTDPVGSISLGGGFLKFAVSIKNLRTMELKEFIRGTLTQIAEGVRDAQESYSKIGGVVNPSNLHAVGGDTIPYGIVQSGFKDLVLLCNVHFEVALTKEESGSQSDGIGVFLDVISLGHKDTDSSVRSSVTRITFDVPVSLPSHK